MADLALLEAAELLYTESASSSPPPHEPWSSSRLEGPLCAALPDLLLDLCRLLLTRETSTSSDSRDAGGNSTAAIFQQHVGVVLFLPWLRTLTFYYMQASVKKHMAWAIHNSDTEQFYETSVRNLLG